MAFLDTMLWQLWLLLPTIICGCLAFVALQWLQREGPLAEHEAVEIEIVQPESAQPPLQLPPAPAVPALANVPSWSSSSSPSSSCSGWEFASPGGRHTRLIYVSGRKYRGDS